jgi:hypothetical protein
MARTPQDFDEWFRKSGGDPWGYGSDFVQDRLDSCLRFIVRHVSLNFSGSFIELGAFNGEFTKRIAAKFPNALVAASDISPIAVEMARTVVNGFQNVRLDCADMATFELPAGVVQPIKLLLLDCIYYMPEAERGPAIEHLMRVVGQSDIFVSCPITGDPYPTEGNLMRLFRKLSYRCAGTEVLNYKPSDKPLVNRLGPKLSSIAFVRRHTAHQVIYRFAPLLRLTTFPPKRGRPSVNSCTLGTMQLVAVGSQQGQRRFYLNRASRPRCDPGKWVLQDSSRHRKER